MAAWCRRVHAAARGAFHLADKACAQTSQPVGRTAHSSMIVPLERRIVISVGS